MKRLERQLPNSRATEDGVQDIEAEVERARLSFDHGRREGSLVGSRAARRVVTPALLGVCVAGGALLLLALARLARRRGSDGALVRIVIEPPRSPKHILPVAGVAIAQWLLGRQLRAGGPLGSLLSAVADQRAASGRGTRASELIRGFRRYES